MEYSLIPIHCMPSDDVRKAEILKLGAWLSRMLTLTGENSADRLEVILPIIQKYAWTLSCKEIVKAFDMYIQNKLSYNGKPLEPRDNYLTPILFNKVIKAYKETNVHDSAVKNRPALPEPTEDDKNYSYAITCFDQFVQGYDIPHNMSWIYDYLEKKKVFEHTKEEKVLKVKAAETLSLNETLSQEELVLKAKRMFLEDLFEELKKHGNHLRKLL